jgi:NACalpha-BTF3-like transcription factor
MKILHYIIAKIGFEVLSLLYFLVRWFVVALLLTYGLRWLGVSEGVNRIVNTIWFVLIAAWSAIGYVIMKKRLAEREEEAIKSAMANDAQVGQGQVGQSIWQRNGYDQRNVYDQHMNGAAEGSGQTISWAAKRNEQAVEQAEEPSSASLDYAAAREEAIKSMMSRLGASREDAERILHKGGL